jgi:pyruvate formate lyase activating enzyme
MKGTVFDIQHYAMHDGPGIRTLVFLKGCPLRCTWCCNPESQLFHPQLRYHASRCTLCGECVKYCPSGSLHVSGTTIRHSLNKCNECTELVCIEKCNYGAVTMSGRIMDSSEVIEKVARDIPFYRNSGGGVTFSGGEPLSQPQFLLALLTHCQTLGIHTAIETSGYADLKTFQQIIPLTGLFLFDLKITDPYLHLAYTGKPVAPVLANLSFLAAHHDNIIIRVPLVPEITDTFSNLDAISEIMARNSLRRICIEPYHTLGTAKYIELGMVYRLPETHDCLPARAESAREFFIRKGFECEIS